MTDINPAAKVLSSLSDIFRLTGEKSFDKPLAEIVSHLLKNGINASVIEGLDLLNKVFSLGERTLDGESLSRIAWMLYSSGVKPDAALEFAKRTRKLKEKQVIKDARLFEVTHLSDEVGLLKLILNKIDLGNPEAAELCKVIEPMVERLEKANERVKRVTEKARSSIFPWMVSIHKSRLKHAYKALQKAHPTASEIKKHQVFAPIITEIFGFGE